ncbi:hypothetical protein MRS44_016141 [Fusarium solani]|uniref:uncharacterized protein n=1 Tax=Fusarium solani TaxID=169388 RepID=UPI0032C42131|nr:hypothetical protein MRS44_016141 [Fusarium solani]
MNRMHGVPCTNCALDCRECLIKQRARRGKPKSDATLLPAREPYLKLPQHQKGNKQPWQQPEPASPSTALACEDSSQHLPEVPRDEKSEATDGTPFVLAIHYPFIDPGAVWRLSPGEMTLLEKRRCFQVPAEPVLAEFIQNYFMYMHPFLPLVDEASFWELYSSPPSTFLDKPRFSLFVVHTLLFISSPFVATSTLNSLGFEDVQAAQAEFYLRAKTLFDFDCFGDDFSCAQGALMLTYHAPTADCEISIYWLRMAIARAESVGADRYCILEDSRQDRIALKRLWWCCILRDRVMALAMGRPLTIKPASFDFTQPGLLVSDFREEIRRSEVYSAATKQVLVQLVVTLCELVVPLNDVLTLLHSAQAFSLLDSPQGQGLEMYHSQLDRWRDKAQESFLIPAYTAGIRKSVLLFTKMMYIYYHTAKARLCFRIIIASMANPDDRSVPHGVEARCVKSQSDMSISLHNIAEDLAELSHDGLVLLLPNTFVAFSAFPLLWAILETNVIVDDAPSSTSQRDLNTCAHVMQVFRGRYQSAESVLRCIKTTVHFVKDRAPSRGPNPQTSSSMDKGETRLSFSPARENVWVHLLSRHPNVYYQIARMIDRSFSEGRILAADWTVSREFCHGEEYVDYAYSFDQLLDMALGFIYGV